MDKLFLLKPNFEDSELETGKKYFCPPCALIEGALSYYPELNEKLDIEHVDFERPRQAIVELVGEENQSCPVLILSNGNFINDPDLILEYLAENYQIGYVH